jgi:hypothetical protein
MRQYCCFAVIPSQFRYDKRCAIGEVQLTADERACAASHLELWRRYLYTITINIINSQYSCSPYHTIAASAACCVLGRLVDDALLK